MTDLDDLLALTPQEFEMLAAQVLESLGYEVEVSGKPGDEGVDVRLRRGDEISIAQCKRYSGTVGQPEVRDFYGAMQHEKAVRGYFVTSGTFSLGASTWAQGKPIILVDGPDLLSSIQNEEIELKPKKASRRTKAKSKAGLAHALRQAHKDPAVHGRILIDGPPPEGRDYKDVLEYARRLLDLREADVEWAEADRVTFSSSGEYGSSTGWMHSWYRDQRAGVAFVNEFEHTKRADQLAILDHQTKNPAGYYPSVQPRPYILLATKWEGRMYKVVRVKFSTEIPVAQVEWDQIPSLAESKREERTAKEEERLQQVEAERAEAAAKEEEKLRREKVKKDRAAALRKKRDRKAALQREARIQREAANKVKAAARREERLQREAADKVKAAARREKHEKAREARAGGRREERLQRAEAEKVLKIVRQRLPDAKAAAAPAMHQLLEQKKKQLQKEMLSIGLYCADCGLWGRYSALYGDCNKCERTLRYDPETQAYETKQSGVFGTRWYAVRRDQKKGQQLIQRGKDRYVAKTLRDVENEIEAELVREIERELESE